MRALLQWLGLVKRPVPVPRQSNLPLPAPELVHAHYGSLAGDQHFVVVGNPSRSGFKVLTLHWDSSDWETAGAAYWAEDDGVSIYADATMAEEALIAECKGRQIRIKKLEPSSDPAHELQPWLEHGRYGADTEGWLVGNPAGLELLRDKLNEALNAGESRLEEPLVEIAGIQVVRQRPTHKGQKQPSQLRDAVAVWGCGLAVVVLILVLLAGAYQIWIWLK